MVGSTSLYCDMTRLSCLEVGLGEEKAMLKMVRRVGFHCVPFYQHTHAS